MNQFKVLLYNGTQFVDISKLIQTNANLQDKLDLTLDFASFVIPHAKQSYEDIPGIDFSKPIKPWMPLILDINNGSELYRFYTTNCTMNIVGKGSTKRYKHDIQVIEASKSLWGKPIPDMTITQPKSAVFEGKYFSSNKASNETINNDAKVLNFSLINNSSDITIVDNLTLKKAGISYDILYNFNAKNMQYNRDPLLTPTPRWDAEVELQIDVYIDNVVQESERKKVYIGPAQFIQGTLFNPTNRIIPSDAQQAHSFTRIALTDNEVVSIKAKTLGIYKIKDISGLILEVPDEAIIEDFYLTLSSGKTDDVDEIPTLKRQVLKILDNMNTIYGTSYYLSDTTAPMLDILAPELTFQSLTAWDALEKLANYVNAIPEVGLENYSEISFRFLDEEPDLEYEPSVFTEETQAYIFDDYNAGYEINAANVIEEDSLKSVKIEPYIGGWMTPRINSTQVAQYTENNAAFKTRQNIYKVHKMFIKGPQVVLVKAGSPNITLSGNAGGTSYDTNTYWDISNLVVETQRWNTFENGTANDSDLQRIDTDTKGNHIHYSQGTKYIQGLDYKTDKLSDFLGTTSRPRALMETILRAAAQYISTDSLLVGYSTLKATNDNAEIAFVSGHNLFKGILAQIHYIPLANVRSTVYRYDAYNKGIDIVKFANEQDRLNDTTNLGEYTRKTLNKLGNTIYTVSGRSSFYNYIPKLGYKTTDGKIITSRNINLNKNLVTYDLELSENFLNQSSYVGVNSAFRQFEVPADDYVHRQDKYREFIVLTKDNSLTSESNFTQYGKRMFLDSIQRASSLYNKYPLSYGKMTITKKQDSIETDNIKAFDVPINGFPLATTINLQLEADDNYSMGPRIEDKEENPEGYRLQNFARYVSEFGKFYSFDLELRQRGTVNNTEVDANEYPFNINNTYDTYDEPVFQLVRENVDKDAREKYGLNLEFPVISSDPSMIRVYPGFAKYNSLIRSKDNMTLGFALLTDPTYFPSVNDTKLNTSRVTIMSNSLYNTNLSYIGGIYNVTYTGYIEANQTVYGYVLYEATTNELIMAVKEEFYNDDTFGVDHDFSPIYSVHKRNLNTYMYPDTPAKYTVTFVENGGSDVQNQVVWSDTKVLQPSIVRPGYTLDGWFTNPSLLEIYRYNFNNLVTSDLTLYAKWNTLPVGNHTWERVYTSTYDTQIFPEILDYTCPTNYEPYLPDADLYAVGYTVNVMPYRLCNSSTETCLQNPIDMSDFRVCEERQYRVIEA